MSQEEKEKETASTAPTHPPKAHPNFCEFKPVPSLVSPPPPSVDIHAFFASLSDKQLQTLIRLPERVAALEIEIDDLISFKRRMMARQGEYSGPERIIEYVPRSNFGFFGEYHAHHRVEGDGDEGFFNLGRKRDK